MADIHRKVIEYVSDITSVLRGIRTIENANAQLTKTLGADFGKVTKVIGNNMQQISTTKIIDEKGIAKDVKVVEQLGTSFQTTGGKAFQATEQITTMADGTKRSTTSIKALDKNTVSLGQNMARLAKRAALTIPIWLALRSAVTGVTRTIRDGLKAIADFDKRLQKARRNLQGTPREVEANFQRLRDEVTRLSLETGISVEEITTAFQRFATTGQDFETSMGGAIASVKLATAEFGDTVQVADALARTYKILGDTIDDNIESQDRLSHIAALIDELWKTNAFDINELGRALERFASTANVTNVSLEDSIRLLATLQSGALVAQRGGRLLGSAMIRLLSDLDGVAKVLNIKVNPELDSTVDVLFKVLDALVKIREGGQLEGLIESSEALRELFNLRGQIPIATLVSLRDLLDENFAVTADIERFNEAFEKVTKTTGVLTERFTNANREIGKAFVTGLVGGEDFEDSLEKIVNTLTNMIDNARQFGNALREAFAVTPTFALRPIEAEFEAQLNEAKLQEDLKAQITEALKGALSREELRTLLDELIEITTLDLDIGIGEKAITTAIANIRRQLTQLSSARVKDAQKEERAEQRTIDHVLDKSELLEVEQQLRKELEATGLTEVEIERRILDVREKSGTFLRKELDLQRELIGHLERIEDIEVKRAAARGVIANQIELLRLQGATTVQLLKAERSLEKMFNIDQDRLSQLQFELDLEKEITKEKLGQNKLSSESIKLAEIAEKFGVREARLVAEVVQGRRKLSFIRPTVATQELAPILREFFPEVLRELRAREFLETRGIAIPIREREAIQRFNAEALRQQFQELIGPIQLPAIETNINTIKVELKQALTSQDIFSRIVDDLANTIRQNPELRRAIEQIIENY